MEFGDDVLASMTDMARVKKIYKLNIGGGGKGGGVISGVAGLNLNGGLNGAGKEERERRELEMLVLGCMALRGSTN